MTQHTDDWRGENLIRATPKLVVPGASENSTRSPEQRTQLKVLVERIRAAALEGKTQAATARHLKISSGRITQLAKANGIKFINARITRRQGLIT